MKVDSKSTVLYTTTAQSEFWIRFFFFFGLQCVQYAFLPTNSPDLNPVENCFGQIKKILLQERYREIISQNLKLATIHAIKEILQTHWIQRAVNALF